MNKVIIYTDGACSGNQSDSNFGGWGVVLQYNDNQTELFGGAVNTTNNKMELQGAIEGLKAADKDIPVEMYLDSNYVVQGITSWIHGWKKNGWKTSNKKSVENKDLWIELDELRNKFAKVDFIKVKGHVGVELNELADKLANKGVDSVRNNKSQSSAVEHKTKETNSKTITAWDRLRLQIDNLEVMYKNHQTGVDVSTQVYWQVETINEMLNDLEEKTGANKIRKEYNSMQ